MSINLRNTVRLSAVLLLTLFYVSCSDTQKNYRIALQDIWKQENITRLDRNFSAFSYDLLQAIAREQNISIHVTVENQADMIRGFGRDTYDAILLPMKDSSHLLRSLDVSHSYLKIGLVLVTSVDFDASDTTDSWEGKILAIPEKDFFHVESIPYKQAIIHTYSDIKQTLEEVADGFCDGALIDYFAACHYCEKLYMSQIKMHSPFIQEGGAYLVVQKGQNQELLHEFNQGLTKIIETGYYDTLMRKWQIPTEKK